MKITELVEESSKDPGVELYLQALSVLKKRSLPKEKSAIARAVAEYIQSNPEDPNGIVKHLEQLMPLLIGL